MDKVLALDFKNRFKKPKGSWALLLCPTSVLAKGDFKAQGLKFTFNVVVKGHIFGNRQKNIQNALSNQSGLDATTVCRLLKMAAPVVMGLLEKQQRQQKNDALDRHGLSNILGSLVGDDFQNKKQSFFESILDADNDGSIIDDLVDTVAGKKNTGIVNVFGKMFNKK